MALTAFGNIFTNMFPHPVSAPLRVPPSSGFVAGVFIIRFHTVTGLAVIAHPVPKPGTPHPVPKPGLPSFISGHPIRRDRNPNNNYMVCIILGTLRICCLLEFLMAIIDITFSFNTISTHPWHIWKNQRSLILNETRTIQLSQVSGMLYKIADERRHAFLTAQDIIINSSILFTVTLDKCVLKGERELE